VLDQHAAQECEQEHQHHLQAAASHARDALAALAQAGAAQLAAPAVLPGQLCGLAWPLPPLLTADAGSSQEAAASAVRAVSGYAVECGRLVARWVLQDALHAASEAAHLAQQAVLQLAQPGAAPPPQPQPQPPQQQQQQQQQQQAADAVALRKQVPQLTVEQFVATLRLAPPKEAAALQQQQLEQLTRDPLCAAAADAVRSIVAAAKRTSACRTKLPARTLVPLPPYRTGHVPVTTSILAAIHLRVRAYGAQPDCSEASVRQLAAKLPAIPTMFGNNAVSAQLTGGDLWRSWVRVDKLRPECKEQRQGLQVYATTDGVSLHLAVPR
jgi:hypothetical protein